MTGERPCKSHRSNQAAVPTAWVVTVEGTPTGLKMETDKKGITRLSMNVTGNGISAQVTVTLSPSDNRATATIIPNFNSLNVTLDGQLVPFKESSVFKGTTF